VTEVLAIVAVLAVIAAAWFNQKRVKADERARRAETTVEVYEGIDRLKAKVSTDAQAADEVNKAWSTRPPE
tara:strand:- start:870 stop:1082 length:213 start_codon:yes stop_codon:yes gene_type:complete